MGASILIQGAKEYCDAEQAKYQSAFRIISISTCPIYTEDNSNQWLLYIYYDEKDEE